MESHLELQIPHRLRAAGCAEPGVVRLQPRRIQAAIRQVLGVPDRQVRRAVVLNLRRTPVDHDGVEGVEHVEPELQPSIAPRPDVPQQRKVDDAEKELRGIADLTPEDSKPVMDLVRFIVSSRGTEAGRKELQTRIAKRA